MKSAKESAVQKERNQGVERGEGIRLLKQEIREKIRGRMDYGRDYEDEEIEEMIDEALLGREELTFYPVETRLRLKKELFDSMRRLDILQLFVEDGSVTEIMINGKDHVFVERDGKLERLEISFESEELLKDVIQILCTNCLSLFCNYIYLT